MSHASAKKIDLMPRRHARDGPTDLDRLIDRATTLAVEGRRDTSLSLVLWDATIEKTGPLKLVGGAQADGARSLGLTKISEESARRAWNAGLPIIFVGNKVNDFHFFKGWGLAQIHQPGPDSDFDTILNAINFYLEPELGNRVSTFMLGLPPRRRGSR